MDALKVNTSSDHPALTYQGNALKRHQVWLQTNYHQGVLKYCYTGLQQQQHSNSEDMLDDATSVNIHSSSKLFTPLRQLRGAASAIAHYYCSDLRPESC